MVTKYNAPMMDSKLESTHWGLFFFISCFYSFRRRGRTSFRSWRVEVRVQQH